MNATKLALQLAIEAQNSWTGSEGLMPCPIFIIGKAGTGKTRTVEAFVKASGKVMAEFSASQTSPELIGGFPFGDTDARVMRMMPSDAVEPLLKAGPGKGVIFLDELPDADPMVQSAMHAVMTHRRFGNVFCPPRTAIVAAGNPPDISTTGGQLSIPMAGRVCQLVYEDSVGDFCDALNRGFSAEEPVRLPKDWSAGWSTVAGRVSAFLSSRPELFETTPSASETLLGMRLGEAAPRASRRTWCNAIAFMAACDSINFDGEARELLVMGCVGEGTAYEYLNWERDLDLPDPEDCLINPLISLPKRDDLILAVCHSVTHAVVQKNSIKRFNQACDFFKSLVDRGFGADMACLALRNLVQKENIPTGMGSFPDSLKAFIPLLQEMKMLNN